MKDLKVIFMGTPDFAVPVLKELIAKTNVVLVVTQPDKKVGRKQEISISPIKKVALEFNIPLFQPTKIKEEPDKVLETYADIIITCAYGQFIPKCILDYPRLGCINVHASLLPKYRGGAPIHYALINGEEKTGITIMYMDTKMDNGDIIAQKEIGISADDNVATLHDKLSVLGADLLIETLPSIINGENKRIKQAEEDVSFAYNITREQERIDFNLSGKNIINQIRGMNPWPMANCLINGLEVKILEARFEKADDAEPSLIKIMDKNKLGITCLDGIIYVEKIKPFGKKVMNIKDFLNGIKREDYLGKKVNEEE